MVFLFRPDFRLDGSDTVWEGFVFSPGVSVEDLEQQLAWATQRHM